MMQDIGDAVVTAFLLVRLRGLVACWWLRTVSAAEAASTPVPRRPAIRSATCTMTGALPMVMRVARLTEVSETAVK